MGQANSNFVEKKIGLDDKYVTAGNRLYVIGTQDGLFPDFGGHIKDEMGGVWGHPTKFLDGFFIGVEQESGTDWPLATSFRTYPFYTEHHYDHEQWQLVRRQFVPDHLEALIVTFEYTNRTSTQATRTFKCVFKSDIRPGWLGTETDGEDQADLCAGNIVIQDSENPWFVCISSSETEAKHVLTDAGCPFMTKGKGVFSAIEITKCIEPGATVSFQVYISGSTQGQEAAERTMEVVKSKSDELFRSKEQRYKAIDETTKISIPNFKLERSIRWVKYNTDWLVRTVPSIGNGLGAGLPEYPWWFGCDNGYALLGALPLGMFAMSQDTLKLLARVSDQTNGNGRIIHEVSSTGIVYNPGNTQETPQFCKIVWDAFTWTGDMAFLEEMYPYVRKAIDWIISQADGDDLASGYGIMEVEGLNVKLIDTAVYTEQAFEAYANMAELFGDSDLAEQMRGRAERLRNTINQTFWLDNEGIYADVLAPSTLMDKQLEKWAERFANRGNPDAADRYRSHMNISNPRNLAELPYSLKNWVISSPMEVGIAPEELAERALTRMRTDEFKGPHGLYLSGTDRDRMMTISTSVQAVAECRYGHSDEAVLWLELVAGTQDLRMPGSISEMSPDYGCFVQAWTVYGMVYPIVCQMFGVTPIAHESACSIRVQMPTDWNDASVSNLCIGDNKISLRYKRSGNDQLLSITSEKKWSFRFAGPVQVLSSNVDANQVDRNDNTITLPEKSEITLKLPSSREGHIQ